MTITAQVGGVPVTIRATAPAAAAASVQIAATAHTYRLGGLTGWIYLENLGGVPLRVYWNDEDVVANTNYVEIANGALPLSIPLAITELKVSGQGGACAFALLAMIRRG